ncbi:MAG: hypothetical protein CMI02_05570 [Oceanospirillaceae bacterium]|nr:hypothetical protein [Oceanospirillaceae bacterium]MBT11488.1 hypothetical protein [Oceanospirillaceae bacterium]|tara:strand:- start:16603 stop:18888 length:2286 start_codon:yes stop_codon:yes gene_type:complete
MGLIIAVMAVITLSGCQTEYSGDVGGASNGGDGTLYNAYNPEGQRAYEQQCASCHGVDGNGTSVGSSLVACATCTSLSVLAQEISATMPISNTGACTGDCATNTAEYIMYAFNGEVLSAATTSLDGVQSVELAETLRKASLQLADRLPTAEELAMVAESGETGLSLALNQVMTEDAFYENLMEIFNVQLLTDKYLSRNLYEGGINLLDSDDYPNRKWYNDVYAGEELNSFRSCVRSITNDAVARAPLELIRYAAMNNLPHTTFMTADYMMVNWYSQQVYDAELIDPSASFRQLDEPVCDNNGTQVFYDPTDFRPARINKDLQYEMGGIPHAGILTDPMFLNRYPTTSTNRNRHRSRIVFDYFLDTDILAIEGDRPGDGIGSEAANPTLLDPACYACHQVMDPVASAFQHWTDRGQYIVTGSTSANRWDSSDIEPAGLRSETIPLSGGDGYFRRMLQWLGNAIAEDPRFVRATVRTLYTGIVGQEPLTTPGDNASNAETLAFNSQRAIINSIGQNMVADNWNIKTAVKGIVMSPYYRASAVDTGSLTENKHIGSTQFLSPEAMQAKLNSVFGFGWDEFRSENNRIMYGGMDSDSVTEETKDPSGLIIAIQERMATEMACRSAAYDFTYSSNERRLFPYVEVTTEPQTDTDISLIKHNIQHLHWRLLGEHLEADSAELEATYQLFVDTLNRGQNLLQNADQYDPRPSTALEWECRGRWNRQPDGRTDGDLPAETRIEYDDNYVIRAWTSVLTYLISDYRFVYE